MQTNDPLGYDAFKTSVNISSLDPSFSPLPSQSIYAVVTLVWPFSSSSKSTAILLADPDFRLRRNKGQVRVKLHGAAAKAFVESGVGIGDEVQLSLAGAKWIREGEPVKTPGRCVDGELYFGHKFALEAQKADKTVASISVDEDGSDGSDGASSPIPKVSEVGKHSTNGIVQHEPRQTRDEWSSPAFLRVNTIGPTSYAGWEYDPFADDDSVEESPRKRTKFGRPSNEWRYVEDDSPTNGSANLVAVSSTSSALVDSIVHAASPEPGSNDEDSARRTRMKPPALPPIATPSKPEVSTETRIKTPSPPRLKPVQSPGLPLPSPFPTSGQQQMRFPFIDQSLRPIVALEGQRTTQSQHLQSLIPSEHSDEPTKTDDGLSGLEDDEEMKTFGEDGVPEQGEYSQELISTPEATLKSTQKNVEVVDLLSDSESESDKEEEEQIDEPVEASQVQSSPAVSVTRVSRTSTLESGSHLASIREDASELLHSGLEASSVRASFEDEQNLHGITQERFSFGESEPHVPIPFQIQTLQDAAIGHSRDRSEFDEFFTLSPVSSTRPLLFESSTVPAEALSPEVVEPATEEPFRTFVTQPMTPENSQQPINVDEPTQATVAPMGQPPLTPLPSDLQQGQLDGVAEEDPGQQLPRPRRRSTRLRNEEVPESISQWFTSRRKSKATADTPKVSAWLEKGDEPVSLEEDSRDEERNEMTAIELPRTGFRTRLSYFTPLSSLRDQINNSASQTGNTVDVMAIISGITLPKRAKYGPKDHYIVIHLTEPSLAPKEALVETFRPWKKSLPTGEVGDVALLRNYVVKSRKNSCYLLSGDNSGWLVWRYPEETKDQPVWSKMADGFKHVKEECRGPPVEIGEEERAQAQALRHWWLNRKQTETAARGHYRTRSRSISGTGRDLDHPNGVGTKL